MIACQGNTEIWVFECAKKHCAVEYDWVTYVTKWQSRAELLWLYVSDSAMICGIAKIWCVRLVKPGGRVALRYGDKWDDVGCPWWFFSLHLGSYMYFVTKQYKTKDGAWLKFMSVVLWLVFVYIVFSVSDACMPSARKWCLDLYVGRRPGLYSVYCASLGVCMWLLMLSLVMRLLIFVTALIRFVCMLS